MDRLVVSNCVYSLYKNHFYKKSSLPLFYADGSGRCLI
jgi:hypothetical protein